MSLAILIAYIIGSLVKWNILAWYCSFMSSKHIQNIFINQNILRIIDFFLFYFQVFFGSLLSLMPESPVWLKSKNRLEEAEKSIAWLKLTPISTQNDSNNSNMSQKSKSEKVHPQTLTKTRFFSRPILLPLSIGLTLLVLQQVSGIDAIIFFTVEIFRASGKFREKKEYQNDDYAMFKLILIF